MKRFTLVFIAVLFISIGFAQNQVKGNFKRFSIDLYGGLPVVYADIQNDLPGYEVTGRLNWNMSRAFAFGGEFSYGFVKGQNNKYDNEYFSNKYMKALLGGEVFFFEIAKFHELTNWFQPYVGINAGMIKSDIESSGSDLGINNDHFNDWVFVHQYHAGVKFKAAKFMDINARFTLAYIKSDVFDNYDPDFNVNKYNDFLTSAQVGMTFHIGGKDKPVTYWTPVQDCCKDFDTKADKEAQDSIQTQLNELNNNLIDALAELNEQGENNAALQAQIDSLQNSLADLKSKTDANRANPVDGNGEITLLEKRLEGPIDATYYIIVGSYAIKENADNIIAQLEEKGYNPYIMYEESAGLNRIAIDHTDDYEDAFVKATKYRDEVDPFTWIIKRIK